MRPIPSTIKIEIFRNYLEGSSIPEISNLFNVSVGTISSITKEEINTENLFLLFRELAKKIKKNNLNIYDLIPAIHLNSKVEKLGLTSNFFEKFLDSLDTKSFRLDMNLDEFLNQIMYVIDFERTSQIKIWDIQANIEKEANQLEELRKEKRIIEGEIERSCSEIGLMKTWILEYIQQKPLFLMYKKDKEAFFKPLDIATNRNIR
jgi:hypothetical protein